jgi:hypothetical protein
MHGMEGALPKEIPAKGLYQGGLTMLCNPFRKTDQGVCISSEVKGFKPRSRSESDKPAAQARGMV